MSDYEEYEIQTISRFAVDVLEVSLKMESGSASKHSLPGRRRTSKYLGVGSSNRKNQWQARIPIKGKVTHLGYYNSEEEAAKVYDRVCLSLNGRNASLNFPASSYLNIPPMDLNRVSREDLQRSLGVKPMDKSSRFRGVSKKKGKWEAKVMLNRKWAYRELFNSEEDAARAYDRAVRRLKPNEARAYLNFKDEESCEIHHHLQLLNQASTSVSQDANTSSPSRLQRASTFGADTPPLLVANIGAKGILGDIARSSDRANGKIPGNPLDEVSWISQSITGCGNDSASGLDWVDSVPVVHESGQHLLHTVKMSNRSSCHGENLYAFENPACDLKDRQSVDLVLSFSSASPCLTAASLQDRCRHNSDKHVLSDAVKNQGFVQPSQKTCIASQLSMPQPGNAAVMKSVGNDCIEPLKPSKITITTGLHRHSSLPVSATGKLVNLRDEEILGSLEPVLNKLEKCSSLVAQEVLITRTMSADASMLRTTDSPFANPSYQLGCSVTSSGSAAPRSSSFTSGVGTSPNLRRRVTGHNQSPLGRCSSMGLLCLLKFGKSGFDEADAQNCQKAWKVFSGCPLLTETIAAFGDVRIDTCGVVQEGNAHIDGSCDNLLQCSNHENALNNSFQAN